MKYLIVVGAMLGMFALMQWSEVAAEAADSFHSEEEIRWFRHLNRSLPSASNALFSGSGACVQCHGSDPDQIASIGSNGADINVVDDWRATMMANSSKDPFWRAKISHEVIANPQLQAEIETTCTSCHAPLGHFASMFQGQQHYSIQEMMDDSLALDGVSCVSCHQMSPENLGDFFSGNLSFDTSLVAYGPYISPLASPMIESSGYTPVYGQHINTSELCAGCHTLITESVDINGNLTGNYFVEQATYHEWLNSIYNDESSCQSCHLPRIEGPVQIAAGYDTEPRAHFGMHHLVGGNTYMLELMKEHKADLGIEATIGQFDSVFARTTRLLQQQTLELELSLESRDSDTAYFKVALRNLAGHKFPTGYPSRISFIQFTVKDGNGDTLFASGLLDEMQRIVGRDEEFEPHYDVIRHPDEVQIYEMVMADTEGTVTTLLNRALTSVKDNRLPPIGFTNFHESYDTTQIRGAAVDDPNFNIFGKQQGTGGDELYYHVPLQGYSGELTATATMFFQPLPPRWMDEMFSESSEEIDYFEGLYNNQSPVPVVIVSDSLVDGPTAMEEVISPDDVHIYYQLGQVHFISANYPVERIQLFRVNGQLIGTWKPNALSGSITHHFESGIYIVVLQGGEKTGVRKLMVY